MRIETPRVIIRRPERKDADGLFAISHDPIVIANNCFNPQTMEKVHQYLDEIERFPHRLVMALRETDEFMGEINFEMDSLRYGVEAVMFSYNLLEPFRHKGYMKEALQAAIRYCFEEKKVSLVSARVFADNPDSQLLLKKLGFTLEGTLRRAVRCNESIVHDDCVFSLLKEEYDALQK